MNQPIELDTLIPDISCDKITYKDTLREKQIINKNLNTIYVIGSNVYGLGLLNAVHVLLAYIANSTDFKNSKFSILDPSRSDYNDLLGSPFLNGDIITENDDILTILESASKIKFDFQNIIVLNQYDWLKQSLDHTYSQRIIKAVNSLVANAKKNNLIFIVVDRNISHDEKIPDFDAILCFKLQNEAISKTVLGCAGAEKLKNHGDSLYFNRRTGEIKRGQIPLLSNGLFSNILKLN